MLLDDPQIMEFAAQRDFSTRKLLTDYNREDVAASAGDSENETPCSSQETRRPWPSRRDFELAIQQQMELMSQRVMAIEARQHRHEDAASEPPDYESHASI
ncbi:hypothetical protein C0992_001476 [Termitomyces sp. T32_za158]|nr:hypothetical protein C0992_001476 [Termitomyces sp. T32_za158]